MIAKDIEKAILEIFKGSPNGLAGMIDACSVEYTAKVLNKLGSIYISKDYTDANIRELHSHLDSAGIYLMDRLTELTRENINGESTKSNAADPTTSNTVTARGLGC